MSVIETDKKVSNRRFDKKMNQNDFYILYQNDFYILYQNNFFS